MKTLFRRLGRRLLVVALAAAATLSAAGLRAENRTQTLRPDTLRQLVHPTEVPQLRVHMSTSPLPVEIRQQGRQLCIKSRYNQLLPIYTASGTLYSAMRLNKGTNWLTGLPKGAYVINNRRFTIN